MRPFASARDDRKTAVQRILHQFTDPSWQERSLSSGTWGDYPRKKREPAVGAPKIHPATPLKIELARQSRDNHETRLTASSGTRKCPPMPPIRDFLNAIQEWPLCLCPNPGHPPAGLGQLVSAFLGLRLATDKLLRDFDQATQIYFHFGAGSLDRGARPDMADLISQSGIYRLLHARSPRSVGRIRGDLWLDGNNKFIHVLLIVAACRKHNVVEGHEF